MNFGELIYKRRSVRGFTGQALTDGEISKLLEAAVNAPNACNMQSWHFYVVRGMEAVGAFVPGIYRSEWLRSAPVLFVVCTDSARLCERFGERGSGLFAIQDTACAIDHLMLMAAELGLGSCFIGAFDEAACVKHLSIPEGRRPIALIPVGYAAQELPKRDRRPVSEVCTFIGEGIQDTAPVGKKPYTLKSASIPGAVFDDVNLAGATFNNINMKDASFSDINMSGAKFSDINMPGATFGGMTMKGSSFGCVDMRETKFESPDFAGAVFNGCSMKDVKIENCDIEGLTIDGVDISKIIKDRE